MRHLLPLLLLLTSAADAEPPPPAPPLVRAKVTAVSGGKSVDEAATATLEVVHVYTGPAELVGTTFTAVRPPASKSMTAFQRPNPNLCTVFVKGEEGLWELGSDRDDRTKLVPYALSRTPDNPRHEQAVARAEAVETVAKTKPAERAGVLVQFTADPTPEVAIWALRELAKSEEKAAGEYLDAVAARPDPKMPLLVQVELDVVLTKRKEEWRESQSRFALLRGWVSGRLTEDEAKGVIMRLRSAHPSGELADKLAVELTRTAAENKGWPWSVRRQAIFDVGRATAYCANDEAIATAYEWVFDTMRKRDDIEVRRAAAHTLVGFFPLYPKRLKAVEEHLATEKDDRIADALREAVKKAKEER